MKLTADHIRILEKNRHYYDKLKNSGSLSKCSSVVIDEFVKVYNEAVQTKSFNLWCPSCVVELINLVYINYDKYLDNERIKAAIRPEQTGEQSKLSKLESKGKIIPYAGTTKKQDRRVLPGT